MPPVPVIREPLWLGFDAQKSHSDTASEDVSCAVTVTSGGSGFGGGAASAV
jgi:hypothetical protein